MPNTDRITYRVTPTRPAAHLFAVTLEIPDPGTDAVTLSMPAWIPGSYMIRDFARNILSLEATGAEGPVSIDKLDKQTWRVKSDGSPLCVRYEVYAWELTVRSAHLDRTHGYFNGPSVFLRVQGRDREPCRVELVPPPKAECGDWRVATSLTRDGAERWGFGHYCADDYEDLIDHPVEMGAFDLVAFRVNDVPHWMAVSGRHRADLTRIAADLVPICEEHAALFGELPVDRYLFLTQVVGDGYGGLEHRFSSSLLCSRDDLPAPRGSAPAAADDPARADEHADGDYRKFLGLCSHEYFHLWNVKRIRPAAFIEGGLDREVHTRLLWAFEGITSYYDDLALVRSGRINPKGYLELLAETMTKVLRNPGRLRQTVAESSFDAWTKFYKQDENAPNAIVSYYGKGALTALALDLTIRRDTNGRRSLDDVMRSLWERHGERQGRIGSGVPERGIEALAAEVTGLDLEDFFARALDSAEDLELPELLATVGIGMRLRPSRGPKDFGNVVDSFKPIEPVGDVGMRLAPGGEGKVAVVLDGRPAQRAGIAAGDVVIAIDGLRVDGGSVGKRLRALPVGQPAQLHVFRRDELMALTLTPAVAPAEVCELRLDEAAPADAPQRRRAWLASLAAVGR
jgi:predicted metalloprotease with PDZ domain